MNHGGTRMDTDQEIKLVARKTIRGREWSFRRGQLLVGRKMPDGTWTVWPPGRYDGFLVGVPRFYLRRLKPGSMSRPGRKKIRVHPCSSVVETR